MSGSGSFAVSRSRGEDRFYKPPMRMPHEMVQQQQQQQQQVQRATKSDSAAEVHLPESVVMTELDDAVMLLSQPPSVCSSSPTKPPTTNLDSFLESVTPSVAVRHLSEVKEMKCRTREAESSSFYFLGDLWDTFSEWSAYGVGVQLLLNGEETIKQYYVPFLSGIQLYVDPLKHRPHFRQSTQDSDPDSSMETSRGSSVYISDKRLKSLADGTVNQHKHMNNSEQLNRHLQTGRSEKSSSSDEAEIGGNSPGQLLFEYFELEQPHNRRPIIDKISVLASQFPELRKCRSCDLLPSSWISVAWYPIYRIPMGPTLRDLDASFLTFHNLSTHSRCKSQIQVNGVGVRNGLGSVDLNSKISLPVFGLATYKLKGSILTPTGPLESDKENSLLQAAESWLQQLEVVLPDYQFFRAQYSRLK